MNNRCIVRPTGKRDRLLKALGIRTGDVDGDRRQARFGFLGTGYRQSADRVLGVGAGKREFHSLGKLVVASQSFPVFGEIAIAIAVYEQRVTIQDEPDPGLGVRAEYEETITGLLGSAGWFPGDGAIDRGQINRQRRRREEDDATQGDEQPSEVH